MDTLSHGHTKSRDDCFLNKQMVPQKHGDVCLLWAPLLGSTVALFMILVLPSCGFALPGLPWIGSHHPVKCPTRKVYHPLRALIQEGGRLGLKDLQSRARKSLFLHPYLRKRHEKNLNHEGFERQGKGCRMWKGSGLPSVLVRWQATGKLSCLLFYPCGKTTQTG